MNWAVTVYAAILFFVLTPGILLSLPPKGSKMMVALTHGVVFALVFHFTHKMVWRATANLGMPSMGKKEGMGHMKKKEDEMSGN
jgi:hypothetical protein